MINRKKKIIVAIQARMGSKRVPNKMIRTMDGKTILEHVIIRTSKSKEADQVVLATTSKKKDDILVRTAKKHNTESFRGGEEDIIGRLLGTAKKFNADAIVRLTGDSPLMDPELIDKAIRAYRKNHSRIRFVSNCVPLTYPEGFSIELIPTDVLMEMDKELKNIAEREAFIILITRRQKRYPRYHLRYKKNVSKIRLTLDYPEDFKLIRLVYNYFKKKRKQNFNVDDIVKIFIANPELLKINAHHIDEEKYPFGISAAAIRKAR
jgi:spore coat polysaccharide biosynthesis protein SpsF